MKQPPKQLETTGEVIDALGGNASVARLCSSPEEPCSGKAVSNWRKTLLPAKTYVVLRAALKNSNYEAPDSLWTMIPASEQKRRVS